jgi:hypothetical protein
MTDERHDDSSTPLRHEGRMMELEIRTSASPEQAWLAWADPNELDNSSGVHQSHRCAGSASSAARALARPASP